MVKYSDFLFFCLWLFSASKELRPFSLSMKAAHSQIVRWWWRKTAGSACIHRWLSTSAAKGNAQPSLKVFFSLKRSECYLVAIFDAALRGLVGIGRVTIRTAAAVGTATLGVARTAVVGVTGIVARTAVVGVAAA